MKRRTTSHLVAPSFCRRLVILQLIERVSNILEAEAKIAVKHEDDDFAQEEI